MYGSAQVIDALMVCDEYIATNVMLYFILMKMKLITDQKN